MDWDRSPQRTNPCRDKLPNLGFFHCNASVPPIRRDLSFLSRKEVRRTASTASVSQPQDVWAFGVDLCWPRHVGRRDVLKMVSGAVGRGATNAASFTSDLNFPEVASVDRKSEASHVEATPEC